MLAHSRPWRRGSSRHEVVLHIDDEERVLRVKPVVVGNAAIDLGEPLPFIEEEAAIA